MNYLQLTELQAAYQQIATDGPLYQHGSQDHKEALRRAEEANDSILRKFGPKANLTREISRPSFHTGQQAILISEASRIPGLNLKCKHPERLTFRAMLKSAVSGELLYVETPTNDPVQDS